MKNVPIKIRYQIERLEQIEVTYLLELRFVLSQCSSESIQHQQHFFLYKYLSMFNKEFKTEYLVFVKRTL